VLWLQVYLSFSRSAELVLRDSPDMPAAYFYVLENSKGVCHSEVLVKHLG